MKPVSLFRLLSMIGVAALLTVGTASAADVHVMISAGFHGAYSELGPAFERASGHHLVTTRGPSMGDSPESIPTRLSRGEAADVVILDGGAAVRRIGGPRRRTWRGGDRIPTGRRTDPCRRNYLCRPDPGRTPTDVFI